MPAVILSRLKIDTAEVCSAAGEPEVFLRRLHNLLDTYADRTRRHGKTGPPGTLLPHYNPARAVLRQLQDELKWFCIQQPQAALPLADALWEDGWLETRLLAAVILNSTEPAPPEPLIDRIRSWASPETSPAMLDALLSSGSSRLQTARPDLWLGLIEGWLDDPANPVQRVGLRAVLSLASDPQFNNLPALYRLLNPIIKNASSEVTPGLLSVVEALARRSPSETAFYLRQLAAASRSGSLPRFVRKCLPFFDPPYQAVLKEALSAG